MKHIVSLSLCFLFCLPCFSQAGLDSITYRLQQVYKESSLPGFAVAIVTGSTVVYKQAFGLADIEKGTPFTPETVLNIGSVSKTFIGMALLKAVEQGKLSLDADINDYLPFKVIHPHFPGMPITVRHLATHTSGIIDRKAAYEKVYLKGPQDSTTLEHFLKAYFIKGGRYYSDKNFSKYQPGGSFQYSNIGAALAALVIEGATKTSFGAYTQQHIFLPLQFQTTSWFLKDIVSGCHASLYTAKIKLVPLYSLATYPDGGLRSTLQDLVKYMQEAIRGYTGKGTLLAPAVYKQLFSKQFTDAAMPLNVDLKEPNTGVFWMHRKNGEIGHTGSDPGVTVIFFFNPETARGRIFITNTELDQSSKASAFSKTWALLGSLE